MPNRQWLSGLGLSDLMAPCLGHGYFHSYYENGPGSESRLTELVAPGRVSPMGYMAHHAVLVHIGGYYASDGLADDIADFRNSLPTDWQPLVVGPVPTVVNGDFTAVFLPDGSKEGWSDSDDGDDYRRRFVKLFDFQYEDGSSPCDVAQVRFGGDEPDLAHVVSNR